MRVLPKVAISIGGSGLNQAAFVSIIVPCYNYGAFIADTIASLQAQTHGHWEAIVVDDGSVDDTASRVAELAQQDARIFYLHQQNQGVSVARNAGMALARGEFVAFLDADDLISPTKLQAHIEHFRRCPSVNISYSKLRFFSDSNRSELFTNYGLDSVREQSLLISGYGQETFSLLIRKNRLPLQTAMFRRSLLQQVGLFAVGMKALEDWDYVLRCILRGACVASVDDQAAMAMVRVHPGSATRNIAFADYLQRVYGNVRLEIANLRALGNEPAANFYDAVLKETLLELDRRGARRARKARRKEIMQSIRDKGIFDFPGLYPVLKKYRFKFIYAYLRVFIEEFTKTFR